MGESNGPTKHRLDISPLERDIQRFFETGIAENTMKIRIPSGMEKIPSIHRTVRYSPDSHHLRDGDTIHCIVGAQGLTVLTIEAY